MNSNTLKTRQEVGSQVCHLWSRLTLLLRYQGNLDDTVDRPWYVDSCLFYFTVITELGFYPDSTLNYFKCARYSVNCYSLTDSIRMQPLEGNVQGQHSWVEILACFLFSCIISDTSLKWTMLWFSCPERRIRTVCTC